MRIIFFSNNYPNPIQNGKGTFNHSMISAMGNRNDVHVVSPVAWTTLLLNRLKKGKKVSLGRIETENRVSVEYLSYFFTPRFLDHLYGKMMWKSVESKLLEIAEGFQPDVIFSYWAHPDGEVAVELGKKLNIPVAVMVGGSDILILTKKQKRREAIQNVLNQADAVLTVSQDIRDKVINLGCDSEKTRVVYRGVNRELFRPVNKEIARKKLNLSENEKHFLFVGRLVSVKGLDNLIESCRLVADQDRSFVCHLVGGGPDHGALNQKIQELGLEGKVILEGEKTQEELAGWYQASDAVILPSLSEGIPNVLLEAISSGKTFIASDVGGIPEIADSEQDLLVPAGLVEKLADAILLKMKTPETAVRRSFEPSSWDESAEKIESVLQELIHETPSVEKNKSGKSVLPAVSDHIKTV